MTSYLKINLPSTPLQRRQSTIRSLRCLRGCAYCGPTLCSPYRFAGNEMSAAKGAWLRVVPITIWCLMVISGVAILMLCSHGERKVDFVAARDLPQNTLLGADMLRPQPTARYIVSTTVVKA